MKWQPISTAPKDGTHIILTLGKSIALGVEEIYVAYFSSGSLWVLFDGKQSYVQPEDPFGWIPMPEKTS